MNKPIIKNGQNPIKLKINRKLNVVNKDVIKSHTINDIKGDNKGDIKEDKGENESEGEYVCGLCSKGFVNKYTLERHVETACKKNDIPQILKTIKSLKNINPDLNDINKIIEAVDELKMIKNNLNNVVESEEIKMKNKKESESDNVSEKSNDESNDESKNESKNEKNVLNNTFNNISNGVLNNVNDKEMSQTYNKMDNNTDTNMSNGSKYFIQGSNNVNNNNTNTINNNNNVTFNINVFGTENTTMLNNDTTIREILKLLGKIEPMYPGSRTNFKFDRDNIIKTLLKIYEKIHCDEEHPENHNIYIPNRKTYKPFHVYMEDQWKKIGDIETLKKTIIQSRDTLINLIDNLIECDATEANITDLYMYQKTLREDISSLLMNENQDDVKKLCKEIFMKTYEHRDLLIKSYKNKKYNKDD